MSDENLEASIMLFIQRQHISSVENNSVTHLHTPLSVTHVNGGSVTHFNFTK